VTARPRPFAFCGSPVLLPSYVARASARFAQSAVSEAAIALLGVRLPTGLARAAGARRLEFVAGRLCAARALATVLPQWSGEIGVADDRAPCWPAGVTGSITHAAGFASAAVAPAARARGIGVDSELLMTAETVASVRDVVQSPADRLAVGSDLPEEAAFTVLFSAKESVFKCLHPTVRRMFFFEHVGVTLLPGASAFRATLLVDLGDELPAGLALDGRYAIVPPHAHTGIVLEAR
jgi:enterobactin synthetase component D